MKKIILSEFEKINEINLAIVITIIIAIIVTIVLIGNIHEDRFSTIYLNPESYTNYPDNNEVSFIYGIKSFEKQPMAYHINYFISDTRAGEKEIQLNPGEIFEERKIITLPDNSLPAQIRITVTSSFETYEVHYWLKKPD